MKLSIPNLVSLLRIGITPIFFVFIIADNPRLIRIGCGLYLIGAISDYIDGWYARKFNEESEMGKFIDPLADKFLTTGAFIAFIILDIIPLWMVLIVIIRDISTTLLKIYADLISQPIATSYSAKVKTTIQMVFIAYILLLMYLKNLTIIKEYTDYINIMLYSNLTYILMLSITIVTVWTMIEYIFKNKNVIKAILIKKNTSN